MQKFKTPLFLFLAAALTRLPFTSKLLYNMDSVQFALGADHFDVALHQPQPPGYFLYVLMGRAMNAAVGDINAAFILVGIIFSGLTAVVLYYLAYEAFDRETGVAAAVLGITSPLIWFHGEVALSYMPEAFMSALFAYLCFRVLKGDTHLYWLAAVILGVAGGIRQNTMVFLIPLWLYSMKGIGIKRAVASGLIFTAAVLAWFVPMLEATGGLERYRAALSAHWLDSNWRGIHLHWIAFNAKFMVYFILSGMLLAAAPPLVNLYSVLRGKMSPPDKGTVIFFSVWLLPAFLFHLIIFTHPAVPGHSLIYVVGLLVIAARTLTEVPARRAHIAILALVASVNTFFFIFAPYPLSAKGIREHDQALAGYIKAVSDNFSPSDTEIIATDRFLFSYRHAMYYLPEFRVYDSVLLSTPDGPRLFWGQDRKTYRARFISPLPTTRNFIDFLNYDSRDKAGLPAGAKIIPAGDGRFLLSYASTAELEGVGRFAPVMDPSLKGH